MQGYHSITVRRAHFVLYLWDKLVNLNARGTYYSPHAAVLPHLAEMEVRIVNVCRISRKYWYLFTKCGRERPLNYQRAVNSEILGLFVQRTLVRGRLALRLL